MVAIAGVGWVLAPSLRAYVREADAAYPNRDRSSDGSIGDTSHAARASDHNPYDGYVHAVDLDEDLAAGLDLKAFAERLRKARDPRIQYVIYEGRTFKSYAKNGYPAWAWQPYLGPNSHSHHMHLSIKRTDAARNDLRPWGFKPAKPTPKPPAPIPPKDDAMFTYEYDAAGDTPNILVLVAGGKQVRITHAGVTARRRGAEETHLGPVDKTEFDGFAEAFGQIVNL